MGAVLPAVSRMLEMIPAREADGNENFVEENPEVEHLD